MALSDTLYEAGLDIQKGAQWYADSPVDYGEDVIVWTERLADLCQRAAGLVQAGYPLPELPEIDSNLFVGPQRYLIGTPTG